MDSYKHLKYQEIHSKFESKNLKKSEIQIQQKIDVGPAIKQNSDSSSEDEDIIDPMQLMMKQAKLRLQGGDDSFQDNEILKRTTKDDDDIDDQDKDDEELSQKGDEIIQKKVKLNEEEVMDYQSLGIPCSHVVQLQGHSKPVSCFSIDQLGNRIVTGSFDTQVRLYDFHSMTKSMNAFRILTPIEGHVVKAVSFNKTEQEILVVAASAQPKILTRDGKNVCECVKGDQYIKDQSHTIGHTTLVTDGLFSPVDKNIFATSSLDCTIRIWDRTARLWGVESQMRHKHIMKLTNKQGLKNQVHSINFTHDGQKILSMCQDGTVQIFDIKGPFARPQIKFDNCHVPNNEGTKIVVFQDNLKFVTRSMDHSMKIWDMRNTKQAICAFYNLTNYAPGSKACLSPDEKYLLTGTSVHPQKQAIDKQNMGFVKVFNIQTQSPVCEIYVGDESVTDLKWHPVINQILVGSSDNSIHAFYNPFISKKGAMQCLQKAPRKIHPEDTIINRPIKTPNALPMFQDKSTNKLRIQEKIRADPIASKRPLPPVHGSGKMGRTQGQSTVTQFILQSMQKNHDKSDDVQRELQSLEQKTLENPHKYVMAAYAQNQPKPVFDYETPEVQELELLSSIQKICPACGLKICTCKKKDPRDIYKEEKKINQEF